MGQTKDPAKVLPGSDVLSVRKEINRFTGALDNSYDVTVSGATPEMELTVEVSLLKADGKKNDAQSETTSFKTAKKSP